MNSKLANALNDEQKLTLAYVCRTFATYSEEIAFKYLWNLTYKPEYALDRMGLLDEEYLSYYKKVRNYIAEESGHVKFIGTSNDYPKELFMALQQDKFASKRVMMVIENALFNYPIKELERIKTLLSSVESNCQFGGLKSLKLNNDEANYLIRAVEAIANYFSLKFEEIKKNCGITESNQTDKLDVVSENKNNIKNPELINFVPETIDVMKEKEGKAENAIPMVEMLLKNKESIDKFLEVCYDNDTYDTRSEKWNVTWLLEKTEIFKKVILMVQIWNEIQSEFFDYNIIFKKVEAIGKAGNVIKYADDLKALGINAEWIWKNKQIVVNLFEGLDGAAL